jgi:hypothetical protein
MTSPDNITVEGSDAKSVDYTPNNNDNVILMTAGSTADVNVFLPPPTPSSQGMNLYIKKIDSGDKHIIIDANTNGSTIDGSNSMHLIDQYAGVEVFCNGSAWYCLADSRSAKTAGYTGSLDCATASVGTYSNGVLVSVA